MRVRPAEIEDQPAIVAMRLALWPEGAADEYEKEVAAILRGEPKSTLPLALLVAVLDESLVGFVEVGLRSHADGCDPSRPVGFIEGWFVAPGHRSGGVGRALLVAAEDWCRDQGCTEVASDTWIDNDASQRAHEALGFEVVDRCVNFRKSIGAGR